jgi:hypothetical protein
MTDAELRSLAEHRQRSGELIEPRYMIPLLDRIDAVRALHVRQETSGYVTCGVCDLFWPCPTIRALDGTDPTLNPRWAT